MPRYLIIGGSASSVAAVEAIRTVDPEGSLTVITDERLTPYSRPAIGDLLCGEASLNQVQYRNEGFWSEKGVQVFAGKKASRIDFESKVVELEDGEKIGYEKLLLATGSKPFIPEIEGSDKKGVHSFVTIADVEDLKQADDAKSAVVLGGGLIGICVAEALFKNGLKVTIVEIKDHILNVLLDPTASTMVEEVIRKKSVEIITGHTVQRIEGRTDDIDSLGGVVLDNETFIPCDILVIAIGLRPRLELVEDSPVKVNHGVLVDRQLRTNLPGVYAAGDVAEAYDFISGECSVLPQWPVAYVTGQVAGLNMAGIEIEYSGGAVLSALKYFGTPLIAAGETTPSMSHEYEVLESREDNAYRKLVLKDSIIQGFILVGEIEGAGTLYHLMKTKENVGQFKSLLSSREFSVATLPEPVREQMLMEAHT